MLQHLQRCLLLAVVLVICAAASAQEKEQWVTDSWLEVTGEIVEVRRGTRYSELIVQNGTERWILRLGEPWRNHRAGLDEETLTVGQPVSVHGHRFKDQKELRMKALRVVVDGRNYDLYPGQIR